MEHTVQCRKQCMYCKHTIQFSSVSQSCLTLCDPMKCSSPSLPVHHQLLSSPKLKSIDLVTIQPSHPLPSNSPPALNLSQDRAFSNELALCIRQAKYWSFNFNISPTNEHPGLITFRIDWLDLLSVQVTIRSLLQHHNSKTSILLSSAFFKVQFSHPYMTTRKTIALTRWTFDGKMISLL